MKIVLQDSTHRKTEISVTDQEVIEEVRKMLQGSTDEPRTMQCRNTLLLLCGNRTFSICYSGNHIKYQGATARAKGIEERINAYRASRADQN